MDSAGTSVIVDITESLVRETKRASQAEARATSARPLIAMHCANWQVNLHWQNQRGRPGIGRTDPSGPTVTETCAHELSSFARTGYIRDEMLRAYFRYQGRCCEINRSLNKSHARARACRRGRCIGCGEDRVPAWSVKLCRTRSGCKPNFQYGRINKLPPGAKRRLSSTPHSDSFHCVW